MPGDIFDPLHLKKKGKNISSSNANMSQHKVFRLLFLLDTSSFFHHILEL